MSFIDDGIEQRKTISERKYLIDLHASKIYEELWSKITGYINEANQKGFYLYTNGSLHDRTVGLRTPPVGRALSKEERVFKLTLSGEQISAKESTNKGVSCTLRLDVCPDGIVCLKMSESQVSVDDAAIMILKKFIFPELA